MAGASDSRLTRHWRPAWTCSGRRRLRQSVPRPERTSNAEQTSVATVHRARRDDRCARAGGHHHSCQAATNDFRGVNWADQRDNFVDDTLVLGGLSTSDSYATTQTKANQILSGFPEQPRRQHRPHAGQLPDRLRVVLELLHRRHRHGGEQRHEGHPQLLESASSRNGTVDNLTQFWSMWQTIVNKYAGNANVYFEPMNEPHGYSDADWKNLAAQWLASYPSAPRGRVIISGAGYNQRLITIGSDSRFNGTLISRHTYQFLQHQPHHRRSVEAGAGQQHRQLREPGRHHRVGRTHDGRPQLRRAGSRRQLRRLHPGRRRRGRTLQLGTVYWPGVRNQRHVPASSRSTAAEPTSRSPRPAPPARTSCGIHGGSTTTCRRPPPAPTTGSPTATAAR